MHHLKNKHGVTVATYEANIREIDFTGGNFREVDFRGLIIRRISYEGPTAQPATARGKGLTSVSRRPWIVWFPKPQRGRNTAMLITSQSTALGVDRSQSAPLGL
jgi:hypothetical protein